MARISRGRHNIDGGVGLLMRRGSSFGNARASKAEVIEILAEGFYVIIQGSKVERG